jgi:hypothetical protein
LKRDEPASRPVAATARFPRIREDWPSLVRTGACIGTRAADGWNARLLAVIDGGAERFVSCPTGDARLT